MDTIDSNILRHLQRDGRVTNLQLAERVGLSPSACLRRVQALEAAVNALRVRRQGRNY